MITISGKRLNTIEITANETYEFTYASPGYVNIYNDTGGDILISDAASVSSDTSIMIPAGGAYSGLWFAGRIYMKSYSDGKVSIVVKG